ncbi:glutathione S-transferase family protein [Novosphingobium colocasiae]|uniref:GST C-terminal domain-containing protein n=2 Tax=Novosphingobium colocasiae TaxID=1256513 RepID=A0A918PLN2_9SPHN|nr:hypothetical protein GCM10011614_32230 [Novosphingobium colocasiae]
MLGWRLVASALELDVDELPEGYRPNSPIAAALPQATPTALMNFLIGPRAIFDAIEAYLSEFPYFGGSRFSAADIMMHYQVRHSMLMSQIDLEDYPITTKWRGMVEQRPAYIRADKAAQPGGVDEHGLPIGSPMPFPVRRART